MYRLGEREHSHRRLYITFSVFAVLVFGVVVGAKHYLTSNTEVSGSPAVVTKVSYDAPKVQQVIGNTFTMNIPSTWKLTADNNDIPSPTYNWQGTSGEDKNRWISVYVDTKLPSKAVNRALHIQANGATINVISGTSDNCTSFTGPANSSSGVQQAKWENISFLCDTGNYERNVVGIVSPDGLNNINVTGTKGLHTYFFTYTDNAAQPDYTIFTNALASFRAK
jgi:hypothetical protein